MVKFGEIKVRTNKINELYEMSEEIYGNICLMQMFCNEHKDIDDIYKILPIMQYTKIKADLLYANLLDINFSNK